MTENYLDVLAESLEKKIDILEKIQEYSLLQQDALRAEDFQPDVFDEYVDKKSVLIDELTTLDNGFETLYHNLEQELKDNREKYSVQIKHLQELVSRVTEMSVTIQAQEARNKKKVEEFFSRERSNLARNRKSAKAAYDYYKRVSAPGYTEPQLYDNKQ